MTGSGCRHLGHATLASPRQDSTIETHSDPAGTDTNRHSHPQDIRLTEASMEPNSSTPEQAFMDELRRRRAELLESMNAVEH
jgi:hypothetical protein